MSTANQSSAARISIRGDFVWDAQDAYLFDIDGTILRSRDRIHFNSFASSVRQVTGLEISLTGVVLHGGTDPAILSEAFVLSGVASDVWQSQFEAILDAMRHDVVSQRNKMDLWTMPGIEEALRHLAAHGALLGLATGNLEVIGWTKVEQVGLRQWFRFGGFSDRFSVRSEMIAEAASKARSMSSKGEQATVCIVGDTPRDIEAAKANDLSVIAVATGNYSFEELEAFAPDVCASNLADLLAHTASSDTSAILFEKEVLS